MTSIKDISLTEKLRKENLDQYFTLVRMHLSFVVDINTDDVDSSTDKPKQFRWNFNKKPKLSASSSQSNNVSSIKASSENSITEEGIAKVYEILDFLLKEENVTQEGIFRRTGSLSRQQELKNLLMSGSNLELDEGRFSVHDCASVLKGFLAELSQPLLMDQYYQTYCILAVQYPPNAESSQCKLLTALQLLLLLLSPLHRNLLQRLLKLLRVAADNESSNRMSPDTLATMFTPHLLCPRKLAPETLHSDAVALAPIISFMIRQSERLFETPTQLSTDISAYFTIRERKRMMSPDIDLDESISDRTAANTIYTFVDRNRTSAENESNPTDTALAQLYAHIQALPDSQHKRRLVKQFNRQNGYGTPIQIQRTTKPAGTKSLSESIKKHIFNKGLLNKTPKKGTSRTFQSVEEKMSSLSKEKLRFPNEEAGKSIEVSHKNIVLKNLANQMASMESLNVNEDFDSDASSDSTLSEGGLLNKSHKLSPKFISEPNLSMLESKIDDDTPKNTKRHSSRLFRSKNLSTQNLNKKYVPKKSGGGIRGTPTSCVSCFDEQDTGSENEITVPGSNDKTNADEDYNVGRKVSARTSRRDSMKYVEYRIMSSNEKNCDEGDGPQNMPLKLQYLTSTPGMGVGIDKTEESCSTPCLSHFRRASMSPITKSTQKLSKAMQESIMTPRSRKPLIITSEQRDNSMTIEAKGNETSKSSDTIYQTLSPKNDSDFVSSDESENPSYSKLSHLSCENEVRNSSNVSAVRSETTRFVINSERKSNFPGSDELNSTESSSTLPNLPKFKMSHEMSPFHVKGCLTEPFREYLLSRSVLTATPVDLSLNKSNEIIDSSNERISNSLMFCLDGNMPSDLTSSISSLAVINDTDRSITPQDEPSKDQKQSDQAQYNRSPLKNLKNYINIVDSRCTTSPNRKRVASSIACSKYDSADPCEIKKVLVSTADSKENVSSTSRSTCDMRETDL